MEEIRDIKCPDCGVLLGTLAFPEGTDEAKWERALGGHACDDCGEIILAERTYRMGKYPQELFEKKVKEAKKSDTARVIRLKEEMKLQGNKK